MNGYRFSRANKKDISRNNNTLSYIKLDGVLLFEGIPREQCCLSVSGLVDMIKNGDYSVKEH